MEYANTATYIGAGKVEDSTPGSQDILGGGYCGDF